MSTTPVPSPARRARRWLLPSLTVAAIAVAAGLALFQPWKLWIDEVVDEAAPVAAAVATVPVVAAGPSTTAPTATTAPGATATTAPAGPVDASATAPPATDPPATAPAATAPPATAPPVTPPPATAAPATAPAATVPPATVPPATVPPATVPAASAPPATVPPAPAPPAEPAPTSFRSKAHATSGTVRLITLEDGSRVLRFEDLDTDNGPDLKVVLSTGPDGYAEQGAVSLGRLKGNKGSQNYEIPADIDLSALRSVVVWCQRFNVDFGVAALPGV